VTSTGPRPLPRIESGGGSGIEGELVQQRSETRTRPSRRWVAISLLGPLTAVAGVVWAIVQPYRITLLEPHSHDFWYLAIQPPLLVVLAGAVFHFWVVPGLLADLERVEDSER
jgi:hypothetical protein